MNAATRIRSRAEIGWREMVGLPDLGIAGISAKIDSGARTSALHAVEMETYQHEGATWVAFRVPMGARRKGRLCHARVIDERPIKNTSGVAQDRFVIASSLVLGRRNWRIELSLADRENMGFDLILGRTAIRQRGLLINPGRSFLAGSPVILPVKTRNS